MSGIAWFPVLRGEKSASQQGWWYEVQCTIFRFLETVYCVLSSDFRSINCWNGLPWWAKIGTCISCGTSKKCKLLLRICDHVFWFQWVASYYGCSRRLPILARGFFVTMARHLFCTVLRLSAEVSLLLPFTLTSSRSSRIDAHYCSAD